MDAQGGVFDEQAIVIFAFAQGAGDPLVFQPCRLQLLGAAAHLIFERDGRLEQVEIGPLNARVALGPIHQRLHDLVQPRDLGSQG